MLKKNSRLPIYQFHLTSRLNIQLRLRICKVFVSLQTGTGRRKKVPLSQIMTQLL